jgi:hypothetical protein
MSGVAGPRITTIGCSTSIDGLTTEIGDYLEGTDTFLSPINGLNSYSWSANIYKASEISSSRQITGIEYNIDEDSKFFNNQIIKLAHIAEDRFSGSISIDLNELTISDEKTVFSGSFLLSQYGWNDIDFDENFCYNGTDNLVIIHENRHGFDDVSPPKFEYDSTTYDTTIYASDNSAFPTSIDSRSTSRAVIKLKH